MTHGITPVADNILEQRSSFIDSSSSSPVADPRWPLLNRWSASSPTKISPTKPPQTVTISDDQGSRSQVSVTAVALVPSSPLGLFSSPNPISDNHISNNPIPVKEISLAEVSRDLVSPQARGVHASALLPLVNGHDESSVTSTQALATPSTIEHQIPSPSVSKRAWDKPLPIVSNSQWPTVKVVEHQSTTTLASGSTNSDLAALKAHSKDYPWATKMNPSQRNLHRVTIPEHMEDGTPMVRIPSHVLLGGTSSASKILPSPSGTTNSRINNSPTLVLSKETPTSKQVSPLITQTEHNIRRISWLWRQPWKSSRLSEMIYQEGSQERRIGLQRLAEIKVWLNKVVTIENRVNGLITHRDVQLQRLCLCGFCSKSLISSYRYGKSVFLTLMEVEKLKSEVFDVIADQAQIPEVQERQLQPTIVGQDTMLEKAWKHLKEDGVGLMGLYGMGGVGKTTLLTQLNNKFSGVKCGFDFVIWVVASKELHIEKIQDEITQKVSLVDEKWKQKDQRQKADVIYNFLKKKRFVLFLDDIWEKVDLTEIGVPFPTTRNRCKVAFTTRSQDVCAHVGVEDPMEVQCLGENEAFDLFQKKVGKTTLGSDPEIPYLAKIVARKCSGLPLALNVIGETMSCKRTVQEWHHAIEVLTSYAAEFSGMEDKILPLLKYSYDNLKEEHVKFCLLYCALFPEDDHIPKQKLIDYWICEGLINGSKDIEKAENKGYEIIGSLVRASLLMEQVNWEKQDIVSMHDVVREMALWIASDLGIQKEAIIVHAGVGLDKMPKVENWNVVSRMSLIRTNIAHLAGRPECLALTTLLLQNGCFAKISSGFFKSMPKLVVLDLSANHELFELPGISELVSLQYLNLSSTGIHHLPMGLQELKELIHLDLEETPRLASVVGISSLHNLKVLKLSPSCFTWDHDTMQELKTLEKLETLSIGIDLLSNLENFFSSHRLTSCTRSLKIWDINMESSGIVLPTTMEKLFKFIIGDSRISEIKISPLHNLKNLSKVLIQNCKCLKELTLLMFAPNLKDLHVVDASQLEDIINKEKACESVPFPKLIYLTLCNLPELGNIYWSPLPLPCLKQIDVAICPNLKKLPLDSQSGMHGEKGLVIRYREKTWIEAVEWHDEATKTRFLSSCEQVSV
ncbi:hypothetical protein AALP_AA3G336200 [Arabis alpina]|uniref:Uncharacterized protein n=1 Tax=Arabis alpina TaxID=50452 RepID=A0A087HDE1_ARAAL|nr:hypothetical protein AALP_AA3G336200 [Arabis alpina]KFK40144.1 hypothetical protein AALP_AA3G336200 [Arabis alpina]